ncbi:MAG: hypothetical protein JRJ21_01040 [Deltaproteobacteria bacterium]|nr:hypothetical protein [Deltaproteobacteria bacterium]
MAFEIDVRQINYLFKRFNHYFEEFKNFQNPGHQFFNGEIAYKRKILERFEKEGIKEKVVSAVSQGRGIEALSLISKIAGANLVQFQSWRISFGNDDQVCSGVIRKRGQIPVK